MRTQEMVRPAELCLALFLSGCQSAVTPPQAAGHHDAGLRYLRAAKNATDAETRKELCIQAEERCRLALEYDDRFAHAYNCLGLVALDCHSDVEKSAEHFKSALSRNGDFAEAHNNLGTTFFRRTPPHYDAACDAYAAALEIDPGYRDARENYGMCLMRQGTILGAKGSPERRERQYTLARSHLIRLLEIDPHNQNARHHLGFMDLVEKRYASAERNFKRCLTIDANSAICSYNLGNTYLETARCDDAIEAYVGALRSDKTTEIAVGARRNLGVAYERCAKRDGALRQFLDHIKLDPGNPVHHYDLGSIYADKGLHDHAVREWKNSVQLDLRYCPPYFRLAMHADRMLDTDATVSLCRDFISCVAESREQQWAKEVAECEKLARALAFR